ncbi:MAG: hypothetical protein V3U11_11320, partial [Planctomycetota bacterium]
MRSILVVIPVILSAIATGQQPRLTCLSDVGVYAKNGSRLFLNFIPKSTAITKATQVVANTVFVSHLAKLRVTPAISQKTATFVFREQGYGNGAGTATKSPNQPHSWL